MISSLDSATQWWDKIVTLNGHDQCGRVLKLARHGGDRKLIHVYKHISEQQTFSLSVLPPAHKTKANKNPEKQFKWKSNNKTNNKRPSVSPKVRNNPTFVVTVI